ncbi:monooxygenase [Micromonospora sp. NPDC049679]|uniref:monooxygenase n=1 Tax=Micromonospora sp. NPDC049679 TaxID=3155920 RepID=UPI00340D6431
MKPIVRKISWSAAGIVLAAGLTACGGSTEREQPVPAAGDRTHGSHATRAAVPLTPLREGERFLDVTVPQPYTPAPPNDGTDDYRCFLVDPEFAERAFVTGIEFLPQNTDIVHHAVFFRVDPADVAQARTLDVDSPGDGWTCFGGSGIRAANREAGGTTGGGDWIGAWAPGATETVLSARAGYQMEPGSQIVMQLHYNLLATDGKPAGPDRSGLRLRVASGDARLDPLHITLAPGPIELPCAPGESGELCDRERSMMDVRRRFGDEVAATATQLNLACNGGRPPVAGPTQHCDIPVRKPGLVHALLGHMHLLGRAIKVELNPGTPQARTLLDVPVYNFDDQRARVLPQSVAVKPGDKFRVTCTHDATLRARLPELRSIKPRYVVWGDGTSDEMCLGVIAWSAPS